MIRRPPRSTLFPTRRSSDLRVPHHHPVARRQRHGPRGGAAAQLAAVGLRDRERVQRPVRGDRRVEDLRSEEHTSELQSRLHLVCRLLLEKKKNNKRSLLPII